MITETDLDRLLNYEEFARLAQHFHAEREALIQDLRGQSSENVHQIVGSILAYDDILKVMEYDAIRRRHPSIAS